MTETEKNTMEITNDPQATAVDEEKIEAAPEAAAAAETAPEEVKETKKPATSKDPQPRKKRWIIYAAAAVVIIILLFLLTRCGMQVFGGEEKHPEKPSVNEALRSEEKAKPEAAVDDDAESRQRQLEAELRKKDAENKMNGEKDAAPKDKKPKETKPPKAEDPAKEEESEDAGQETTDAPHECPEVPKTADAPQAPAEAPNIPAANSETPPPAPAELPKADPPAQEEESSAPAQEPAEAHTHVYDEGVVTIPATCKEDGVMTYTCSCGDCYTEVIPAHGHTMGEEYDVFGDGMSFKRKCTECGAWEGRIADGELVEFWWVRWYASVTTDTPGAELGYLEFDTYDEAFQFSDDVLLTDGVGGSNYGNDHRMVITGWRYDHSDDY